MRDQCSAARNTIALFVLLLLTVTTVHAGSATVSRRYKGPPRPLDEICVLRPGASSVEEDDSRSASSGEGADWAVILHAINGRRVRQRWTELEPGEYTLTVLVTSGSGGQPGTGANQYRLDGAGEATRYRITLELSCHGGRVYSFAFVSKQEARLIDITESFDTEGYLAERGKKKNR